MTESKLDEYGLAYENARALYPWQTLKRWSDLTEDEKDIFHAFANQYVTLYLAMAEQAYVRSISPRAGNN